MKKAFRSTATALALSLSSAAISAQFSEAETQSMLATIQDNLKEESKDPALEECWAAATQQGDRTALSSLYVIARAMPIMNEVGRQSEEILAGGSQQYKNLRSLYSSPSLTKHLSLIRAYTPALMYCNGRAQIKSPNPIDVLEQTGERYGAPQVQQYIEMMR